MMEDLGSKPNRSRRKTRQANKATTLCSERAVGSIDAIALNGAKDYQNLRRFLVAKLTPRERNPHHMPFIVDLLRDLAANLLIGDIKRLGSFLEVLHQRKKSKRRPAGGKLSRKLGPNSICSYEDIDEDYTDDFSNDDTDVQWTIV